MSDASKTSGKRRLFAAGKRAHVPREIGPIVCNACGGTGNVSCAHGCGFSATVRVGDELLCTACARVALMEQTSAGSPRAASALGRMLAEPELAAPEPGYTSKGRMHCEFCDVSFGPSQFNAWLEHECAGLLAYRERL